MPEKKFNKIEYDKEYKKKNEKNISLHFRIGSDNDVIDRIDSQQNKVDYIRRLVRADIEKDKQK